jgi:predicted small secreted protein
LIETNYFKDDHSVFFCAKKVRDSIEEVDIPKEFYSKNKKIFEEYITYHKGLVKELNKLEGNVYLFGAHIFSQYLLQFGLDDNKIVNILDNDPNKQGKRLYGTNLIVKSPEVLKDEKEGTVILKAGIYNSEIEEQIIKINSNIKFI